LGAARGDASLLRAYVGLVADSAIPNPGRYVFDVQVQTLDESCQVLSPLESVAVVIAISDGDIRQLLGVRLAFDVQTE
jgi:hypothetical protein